jgi:hypothetical protein
MPILASYSPRLETWQQQKQENEQKLGKNLYDAFNSGSAIDNLRAVVMRGVSAMLNDTSDLPGNACGEEKFLDVWKRTSGPSANGLRELTDPRQRPLTATDCADLIRLIGVWLEKGGSTSIQNFNFAFRPGVSPSQVRPGFDNDAQSSVWRQPGKDKPDELAPRDRGTPADKKIESHLLPFTPYQPTGDKSVCGMTLKRARRNSTVLKIDRMFGLLPGADISGTTTDATLVIEAYGADTLFAAYYLLPLGAIVYNFHHTLIEVALSLSLNRCLEGDGYRIGFYTSLTPKGGRYPTELSTLPKILAEAENAGNNRHFLVWYEGSRPAGFVQFYKDDLAALRSSALSLGTAVLAESQSLSAYPTKSEVLGLFKRLAPELYGKVGDIKRVHI